MNTLSRNELLRPPILLEAHLKVVISFVYQKFMGESENGVNSLETRVHGLWPLLLSAQSMRGGALTGSSR